MDLYTLPARYQVSSAEIRWYDGNEPTMAATAQPDREGEIILLDAPEAGYDLLLFFARPDRFVGACVVVQITQQIMDAPAIRVDIEE